MKIATRILLIFLILLGLLSAIVVSMSYLADSRKQTADAMLQLYKYHEMAERLQQNSNDLTRMARSYVATGNKIHEQHYFEILAIQNGTLPRPKKYGSSYWDFISAGKATKEPRGRPVALVDLIKQAGITPEELAYLKTAKKNSDNLGKIEKTAFEAMKGIFPDRSGQGIVRRAPDPAYARKLLYNPDYHQAKVEVMVPIKKFENAVSNRIHKQISANRDREDVFWKIIIALIGSAILFSVLAFLHLRARVIIPIISLSNITRRILSGELTKRATGKYNDEIGDLNDIFNQMIEARIQIEFDLTKHEQSLRTTLNSIGDALIATDIYGNITRMNPVAEKLSGWAVSDATGKPLDEVFHIINAKSRKPAINPVRIVLRKGNVIGLANHTILISKDGSEYQISDSASPIRDDDGDITGVVLVFRDVTEEYTVRQSLHQSEERFKRLFENAEISIWNEDMSQVHNMLKTLRDSGVSDLRQYLKENQQAAWDMAAMVKVVQVNRATLKLFKVDSEDEFFHPINKKFGPDDIGVFINGLYAIWNKEKIFRSEISFQTADDTTINAILSFRIPQTDEDFNNVPVSIIDITELKKAETALKKSEARLSLHVENSPLAIVGCDGDYSCVQWNPAAEKIFGYSQEQALGKHIIDLLVPKEFSPRMSEIAEKIRHQPKGQHIINENVTSDGRVIICEWFNTELIDETGKSIGSASMVQDITKYKIAEDKLRTLSRAIEQCPVSIIITDVHGGIEYVNPKFEKTTGYLADEVIGKKPRILESGYSPEEEYSQLWQAIGSGSEWCGEFHNMRKDGSLFWENTSISPITAEDGTITHFVVVREDVTERRQLEEHLRRSQKMEAIGELAGGISHDFNNLLGIIIGNLDLVMRKMEDDSKLRQQLQKAQNAALRGSSLTRRLLNFSHQTPEASSPANVNKIINSLKELIGKSLTRQISLETVLADDLWMVEINTGDFEDMLVNLSLNARDAMPGGGRLSIETRNKAVDYPIAAGKRHVKPGAYVEIIISDTGSGISKETSSRIFDPFFTTKKKGKGTGLGLAMVYGFIQRSKGYISFYSEENIGTTFRIYLPRSSGMAGGMAQQIKYPEKSDMPLPTGHETILIVDDEEELAFIAKRILDKIGYTTICAHSADEAIQILEDNHEISLLFTDVIMAGSRDGFDLAETAMRLHPGLKILLTSGFAGTIENVDVIKRWGEMLIAKPYRGGELANRVWEVLHKKEEDYE